MAPSELEMFPRELEPLSSPPGAPGAGEARLSGHNNAVSHSSTPSADGYGGLQPHSTPTMLHAMRLLSAPSHVQCTTATACQQSRPSLLLPDTTPAARRCLYLHRSAQKHNSPGVLWAGDTCCREAFRHQRWGVGQTHTLGPAHSLQHKLPSMRTATVTKTVKEGAPWASAPPPPCSLGRPVQERLPAGRSFGRGRPCEPGWQAGPRGGGCPGAAPAPVLPQTGLCRLPGAPMQQLHGRSQGWMEGTRRKDHQHWQSTCSTLILEQELPHTFSARHPSADLQMCPQKPLQDPL